MMEAKVGERLSNVSAHSSLKECFNEQGIVD